MDLDLYYQREDARRVNSIMQDVSNNMCEFHDLLKEARDYINLVPEDLDTAGEDLDTAGEARDIVKRIDKILPIIANICDRVW
jgi:hypothetical protein